MSDKFDGYKLIHKYSIGIIVKDLHYVIDKDFADWFINKYLKSTEEE